MLFGLGWLAPALLLEALARGFSAPAAAAALASAALPLLLWFRPRPRAWDAAAPFLSLGLALPAAGSGWTAAAGAAMLAAGLRGSAAPAAWTWPLALSAGWTGAALVVWARCASLLLGHSLAAVSLISAAAALGAWAAGRASRHPALAEAGLTPDRAWGLWPAGLAALAAPSALRFIGINAGAPEYLESPLLGRGDAAALAFQAFALASAWTALAGWSAAALEEPAPGRRPAAAAAAAALLPWTGYALLWILGPAEALAALGLAGLALVPASSLAGGARLAAAGLTAASLLLAWRGRDAFGDVWLRRLDAAYPGGAYLNRIKSPGEELAAYRFSSGLTVALSDGTAFLRPAANDRAAVDLALIMRPGARRALFVDARSPDLLQVALSRADLAIEAVETHPLGGELLDLEAAGRRITFRSGEDWRRLLLRSTGAFDLIVADVPPPLWRPENARRTTAESFAAYAGKLGTSGLLALRLPNASALQLERVERTARTVLPWAAACRIGQATLLLASPREVDLEARLSEALFKPADHAFASSLRKSKACRPAVSGEGAAETDRRPRNALAWRE